LHNNISTLYSIMFVAALTLGVATLRDTSENKEYRNLKSGSVDDNTRGNAYQKKAKVKTLQ